MDYRKKYGGNIIILRNDFSYTNCNQSFSYFQELYDCSDLSYEDCLYWSGFNVLDEESVSAKMLMGEVEIMILITVLFNLNCVESDKVQGKSTLYNGHCCITH